MKHTGNPCTVTARRKPKASALLIVLCLAALLLAACSSTSPHLSFLDPQGPIAAGQRLHFYRAMAVLLVFVALPVFVVTAGFLWRYRYGAKSAHYTPKWNYYGPLEIASWAGPVVIVVMLAVIVWRDTHKLDPYRPLTSSQPALRVQVIGYDWKWLFIYPDQGIASIGMLAMPVGRPLAMQLTSATVMQSLHIPALGSQIYAMGGMVTQLHLQADQPGRSLGDNNMYNGNGFAQQRFTAVAMAPEAFDAWVSQVRAHGMALNVQRLTLISQRNTRDELIAALGQSLPSDGNLYFSGASATLFAAVVHATMTGTASMAGTAGTAGMAKTAAASFNPAQELVCTAAEAGQYSAQPANGKTP